MGVWRVFLEVLVDPVPIALDCCDGSCPKPDFSSQEGFTSEDSGVVCWLVGIFWSVRNRRVFVEPTHFLQYLGYIV